MDEFLRLELRDILGIQNIGGMGSYLRMPEIMGGLKTQIFSFVQEKLNNRVNGWTFKFFTKGRKEVIINSEVTALRKYVMSCYRIQIQ